MDDTRNRRLSPIVDISHGTCDGSGSGNTSEDGRQDIGRTLCYQFGIGIVSVANHTIGYGSRQ